MPKLAGAALAVRPEDLAIGSLDERPVAGGGLEEVAAQIGQGVVSGTDRLSVHHPVLFPHLGWQLGQGLRMMPGEGLFE